MSFQGQYRRHFLLFGLLFCQTLDFLSVRKIKGGRESERETDKKRERETFMLLHKNTAGIQRKKINGLYSNNYFHFLIKFPFCGEFIDNKVNLSNLLLELENCYLQINCTKLYEYAVF